MDTIDFFSNIVMIIISVQIKNGTNCFYLLEFARYVDADADVDADVDVGAVADAYYWIIINSRRIVAKLQNSYEFLCEIPLKCTSLCLT